MMVRTNLVIAVVALGAPLHQLLQPVEQGLALGTVVDHAELTAQLQGSSDPNAKGALALLRLAEWMPEVETGAEEASAQRGIDAATTLILRGGDECTLCTAMAGFLASIGYPALVNASSGSIVVTPEGELDVTLRIRSEAAPAAEQARWPPRQSTADFAGSAYALAAFDGDLLGELAHSHFLVSGLMNGDTFEAELSGAALERNPAPMTGATCAAAVDLMVGAATKVVEQPASPLPGVSLLEAPPAAGTALGLDMLRLLESLSSEGDADALATLGDVYFHGNPGVGIRQDSEAAAGMWKQAADQGHTSAAMALAMLHMTTGAVEKAAPYLQQTAHDGQGNHKALAQHYLARYGLGRQRDPEAAGIHLREAADGGDSNAQLMLGHAYGGIEVEGVTPPGGVSKRHAQHYYQQAARSGRVLGKFNAAVLALEEQDARTDAKKCATIYNDLSEVVFSASRDLRLLGAMARRAMDVGNIQGAAVLSMLLSDMGHPMGHQNAAKIWRRSAGAKQEQEKSFLHCWAPKPGSNGPAEPEACSFHYWRRAAAAGNVDAMHKVSQALLQWGEDICAPASQAFYWMSQAAGRSDPRGVFEHAAMLERRGAAQQAHAAYVQLVSGSWPEKSHAGPEPPIEVRLAAAGALLRASFRYVLGDRTSTPPWTGCSCSWRAFIPAIPGWIWRWLRDAAVGLTVAALLYCVPARTVCL
mmetsp:Transcript_26343/g.63447  ORF Transcript_26343/g.63447 Transcript_26343/m.63447 type:complete len:701 (-) Transcript_26343:118-2220(-)